MGRTSDPRRNMLRDYLKSARARILPAELGFERIGRRRVPGLRREEVAEACGVSVAWYTWFETGYADQRVSPRFIAAVARTLRLGDAETTYLFSLAIPEMPRLAEPSPRGDGTSLARALPGNGCDALCDRLPIGVYCTRPDGSITYANETLVALLGYASRSEYLRLNVERDLYDQPRERNLWRKRIDVAGSLENAEAKVRRGDGATMYVRDSAIAVRDATGSVLCYQGVWIAA